MTNESWYDAKGAQQYYEREHEISLLDKFSDELERECEKSFIHQAKLDINLKRYKASEKLVIYNPYTTKEN